MIDFDTFQNGVEATKGAINILKGVKDLIPEGKDKEEATKQIQEAERILKLADAKVAQELGYSLCKCTFPPQIMIENQEGKSVCPSCGKIDGEVKPQINDGELGSEQLDILKALLEVGDSTIELTPLARRLQMNEKKLEYYLLELSENYYVELHYNMMYPTRYELGHNGTKYLIDIGAL